MVQIAKNVVHLDNVYISAMKQLLKNMGIEINKVLKRQVHMYVAARWNILTARKAAKIM